MVLKHFCFQVMARKNVILLSAPTENKCYAKVIESKYCKKCIGVLSVKWHLLHIETLCHFINIKLFSKQGSNQVCNNVE